MKKATCVPNSGGAVRLRQAEKKWRCLGETESMKFGIYKSLEGGGLLVEKEIPWKLEAGIVMDNWILNDPKYWAKDSKTHAEAFSLAPGGQDLVLRLWAVAWIVQEVKHLSFQQLESRGVNLQKNQWMNGSVIVDSTVGKDTLFLVTWTTQAPQILLWDPSGTKQGGFVIDTATKMAYFQVPGTAKVWCQLPCRLDKNFFYKRL